MGVPLLLGCGWGRVFRRTLGKGTGPRLVVREVCGRSTEPKAMVWSTNAAPRQSRMAGCVVSNRISVRHPLDRFSTEYSIAGILAPDGWLLLSVGVHKLLQGHDIHTMAWIPIRMLDLFRGLSYAFV